MAHQPNYVSHRLAQEAISLGNDRNIALADVDISPNPDPFNFWTSESEYIKKTGIRIHFFQI